MQQREERPEAGTSPQVLVVDTITKLGDEHRGQVVVAASHGGAYAGYCAAKGGVLAVIFNDAGVGKDRAGIGSLAMLDSLGVPVATASHLSAEIGNGRDMLDHGEISHVNATASELGCRPGQDVRTCAELMRRARPAAGSMPEMKESRVTLRDEPGAPRVVAIDSASLLGPQDEGAIVITGSHGALLGGKPDSVVSVKTRAMVYCDAGLGKNEAGATRLPVLDTQGIAAVTAAADSARIGDARSIYEDGVISRVNQTAQALGIGPGDSVREFVERAGRAAN